MFIHLHTYIMVRQCVVEARFQVAPTGLSICIQTFATCISNASYARKTGSCRHIVCLCRIMINILWIVNLFGQIATVVSGYLIQISFHPGQVTCVGRTCNTVLFHDAPV